jgi:hypothetical protein
MPGVYALARVINCKRIARFLILRLSDARVLLRQWQFRDAVAPRGGSAKPDGRGFGACSVENVGHDGK